MSERKVKSIQCTSCGAPLSLHGGGHKIQSLNCQYCGAVMDAQKDFAVLAKFSDQKAPLYSPLEMGMQGDVKGVQFTVIGIVSWYASGSWWIDYQIFSPTHGYAWLSYENGHWIFLRRTRNLPSKSLWQLSTRQTVQVKEQSFRLFERYNASITYVSGELTWRAKVGDTTMLAEAIDPPYLFEAERSNAGNETEYYMGEYIEADDILDSFNTVDTYPSARTHPLMPYRSKFIEPLAKASKPFAILSIVVAVILVLFMQGSSVSHHLIDAKKTANGKVEVTYTFTISKPKNLVRLDLDTSQAKTIDSPRVYDELGKTVLQLGVKNSNNNYQINKTVKAVSSEFVVPKAGTYRLSFTEQDLYAPSTQYIPTVKLKISQGYVNPTYFMWLLYLSVAAVIIGFISRWLFESSRWNTVSGGSH